MRLSILQVMKLVAYAAVAFGCIAPAVSGSDGSLWMTPRGLVLVAIFEAIVIPLSWAVLSAFVLRPPWQDAVVLSLLFVSISVVLGLAVFALVVFAVLKIPQHPGSVPVSALMVAIFAAAEFLLLRRVIRSWRSISASEEG